MALPSDSDEDDRLFRALQQGSEQAFVRLYETWQGRLYRFALRMSGSRQIAEDVTQELFLALIGRPDGFDPARGSPASYLFGMARNMTRRRLERERPYLGSLELRKENPGSDAESPLGRLTRQEDIESVRAAVLALPAHYREVVLLCELEGQSYAAAAEALACSVGTVRSRLHRARALLTRKLEPKAASVGRWVCVGSGEVTR